MHRSIPVIATIAAIAVGSSATPGAASAGEIALDADAIRRLLDVATPRTIPVRIPVMGTTEVSLTPPDRVRFVDGGVECRVRVEVDAIGTGSTISVRYVPGIDPESGAVRLRAQRAVAETPLGIPIELASVLPAVDLPRKMSWRVELDRPGVIEMMPRRVRVERSRIVLEFELAARSDPE